jgi:hypothetical protein
MSASKEWTEWHLTSKGWQSGTEKIDNGRITKKEPPEDRVISYRFHEEYSSVFSKPAHSVDEIWRCENNVKINELLKKFGDCPHRL